MSDNWRIALALSLELSAVGTFNGDLRVVADFFRRNLSPDDVFWVNVEVDARRVIACRAAGPDPELTEALVNHWWDHPVIGSWLSAPLDLSPLRVSDVVSDSVWRATESYQEVFCPRGLHYQLCITTGLDGQGQRRGWFLGRQHDDFSEEDLELVRCMAPVLVLSSARWQPPSGVRTSRRGPSLPALTHRERQVVTLLAQGLTAGAIGRRLEVTPRTVRKHLERVYDKLHAHDRLIAVDRARSMGLLQPGLDDGVGATDAAWGTKQFSIR